MQNENPNVEAVVLRRERGLNVQGPKIGTHSPTHVSRRQPSAPGGPCNIRRKDRRYATDGSCRIAGIYLAAARCQRCDALRVRSRILEVLRFGTPIRAESGKQEFGEKTKSSEIRCRPSLRKFFQFTRAHSNPADALPASRLLSSFSSAAGIGQTTPAFAIAVRIGRQIQQDVFRA